MSFLPNVRVFSGLCKIFGNLSHQFSRQIAILATMFSMYLKEVSRYFNSYIGYLVIALFLILSGLINWVFPDTSILEQGYASMRSFFSLSPYFLFFLIPAITMRSISGEKAEGMLDWLRSKPITDGEILFAKFFGSFTLVILALLPTLIYVYSLHHLALPTGNLDYGSIIGSYIGLLLLSAGFIAIGISASAMAPNPVAAFLLAVLFSFFMYYGFGALSELLPAGSWAEAIRFMGMQAHYEALSRGVLDSRDLIYFLSVLGLFLYVSYLILLAGRHQQSGAIWFRLLTVVVVLFACNYSGTVWSFRYDFTEEKRFSLSAIGKSTLDSLSAPLHVTVLLDGELPPGFAQLKNATADLLSDMESHAAQSISISFTNPMDLDEVEREAWLSELMERGIQPTQLTMRQHEGSFSQKLIFPVALLSNGQDELLVNLLQNNLGELSEQVLNRSIENLEYAFISALRKMGNDQQAIVGFTEGHGELSDLELRDAMYSLIPKYQVGRIDLKQIDLHGLAQLNVLIIAKPTEAFSEREKFKLDYFLMQGGHLIFALDQLDGSLDSIRHAPDGSQLLKARQLNLDDLLFTYGLRFNYDLLADMNCSQIPMNMGGPGGYNQLELVPWPMYPVFVPQTGHPLIQGLDGILAEYAGTLDTIAVDGVKKEIVLHSSPYIRTLAPSMRQSLTMVQDMPPPQEIRTEPKPVAALLEGSFPSAFSNRPLPQGILSGVQSQTRSKPAKIFAIADGDVFKNQVNPSDQSPYPLGWNRFTHQQYGNKNMLFNLMDYFLDDHSLISLRGKVLKLRLLDQPKLQGRKTYWQILNVVLPVVLVLVCGIVQQYLRRRRFALSAGDINN